MLGSCVQHLLKTGFYCIVFYQEFCLVLPVLVFKAPLSIMACLNKSLYKMIRFCYDSDSVAILQTQLSFLILSSVLMCIRGSRPTSRHSVSVDDFSLTCVSAGMV